MVKTFISNSVLDSSAFDFLFLLSYLPNPSARAGYDTRSIFILSGV